MAKQINITTLDDTQKFILGRPNFVTGPICHRLRELGHDIPKRMEDEQAHALHWMLGMYAEHGTDWHKRVEDYLRHEPVKCDPTATECPKCHNDISKCDGELAGQKETPNAEVTG